MSRNDTYVAHYNTTRSASNLTKKVRKSKKGKEISRLLEREEATLHGTAHDMMYCTVLCYDVRDHMEVKKIDEMEMEMKCCSGV